MIILDCLLHPGFLWSAIYGKTFIQNFYCQAATRGVLCKNLFLEMSQNLQEVTRARVSFLIKLQNLFIKKETLAQVFSCQFCEISKNIFFTEHILWLLKSLKPATLLKETLTQVFSCEFCEISRNIFFTEPLWWLLKT